jgi:hypothetical protein
VVSETSGQTYSIWQRCDEPEPRFTNKLLLFSIWVFIVNPPANWIIIQSLAKYQCERALSFSWFVGPTLIRNSLHDSRRKHHTSLGYGWEKVIAKLKLLLAAFKLRLFLFTTCAFKGKVSSNWETGGGQTRTKAGAQTLSYFTVRAHTDATLQRIYYSKQFYSSTN